MECSNVCDVCGGGVGLVFAVRSQKGREDFVVSLLEEALQLKEAGWLVPASVDEASRTMSGLDAVAIL